MHEQVIFDKRAKIIQWKTIIFSANVPGKTGYPQAKG
jgi:hypothetical protein